MTAFADLLVLQWKRTKAGRVKAVMSGSEDMYLIYNEDGMYIAAIHEDCFEILLEPAPKPISAPGAITEAAK